MKRIIVLAIGLAGLPVWADLPRGEWRTARPVALPTMSARGRVYLVLDEEALAGVKSLSEYRVVLDGRQEVPYRMVLEEGQAETRTLTARIVSRGTLKKEQAQVTLDLGGGAPSANRAALLLRGDNFRSRVKVEGSPDGREWWVLTGRGVVYRHEGRFERTWVNIPPNRYRFLRVTLTRLEGGLPEIEGVRPVSEVAIPRRLLVVPAKITRREEVRKHVTVLELDMGKLTRDLAEMRFEVEEPTFDRPAEIEVASAAKAAPRNVNYGWAATGRLRRLASGKAVVLPLEIAEARQLRISIHNGDDRPLTIRRVTLHRVRRGLVFSADPAHRYQLWYGRANTPQPVYDIQRLPMTTSPADLALARLGPGHKLPVKPPPPPPWRERHRALFWVVLAAVLLLLAVVTLRAMRGVKTPRPDA
jgi:hypothetical protein